MPSRASPANIESRIVAGFVWLLAAWTACVHLAVVWGKSFTGLIGFTPIALLIASAGLAITWRVDQSSDKVEQQRPSIGWFFAAVAVLLSLLFGYLPFWLLATAFICAKWWWTDAPVQIASTIVVHHRPGDRRRLFFLCLIAIALPLLLHQPDKDDAFYLSVATDAIRHPDQAIWSTDTIHDNPNLPVFLPIYKTEAFEHLIALVAKLAHCSCIRADHTLLPMALAIFVMLAWTMLARTLDPVHWFGITLTALLIMLLTGASRSSPGNFAFTRLQQGKSVFASGIVPVLCVYAWRVVNNGSWRNLLLLIAAQIAGVGVSSTAILLGPLVTMAVAVLATPWGMNRKSQTPVLRYSEEPDQSPSRSGSSLISRDFLFYRQDFPVERECKREGAKKREEESALRGFLRASSRLRVCLGFGCGVSCAEEYLTTGVWVNLFRICAAGISCIYPFAMALWMRKPMLAVTWVEHSPLHRTSDEVKKVLGDGPQLWFFLACMLLAPLLVPRQSRRLILAPIALMLAILINPLLTRYLQLHIFSPLTYWRGMWVVPWLICSGAAVFEMARRLDNITERSESSFIAGGGSPGPARGSGIPGLPPPAIKDPANRGNWFSKSVKRWRPLAIIALFILPLAGHPLVSKSNGTYFHFGGLSVDPDEFTVAEELAKQTPPGTSALAPELVACWTATLDHRPPLIFVRPYYTQPNPIPGLDDAGMRNLLGKIAGEEHLSAKDAAAIMDGVAQYRLGAIVLRKSAGAQAAQTLGRAGFKPTPVNQYILWIRI